MLHAPRGLSGEDDRSAADAEPGKILHEMRGGEMAALHEVPFGLYYGSVDSTPFFVLLAGLYLERTGDVDTIERLWPSIEAALGWIDGPGDPDGDGFVEYKRATEQGLANQGWKDSHDAIFHADGRLAEGRDRAGRSPGLCLRRQADGGALRAAARPRPRGGQARGRSRRLRRAFRSAFWCPEIGTYALALDGAQKTVPRCARRMPDRCCSPASPQPDRGGARRRGLLRAELLLRLGHSHRGARRGPLQSDVLSQRLDLAARQRADRARARALRLQAGGRQPCSRDCSAPRTYMEHRRLPELFCGFPRQRGHGPTLYPVACSPQAWASATPFTLLEASLGLEFDPFNGEIRLRNPRLPAFLDEVTLRNLQLGSSSVDLRVSRHSGDVSLDTLRINGGIRVSVVFSVLNRGSFAAGGAGYGPALVSVEPDGTAARLLGCEPTQYAGGGMRGKLRAGDGGGRAIGAAWRSRRPAEEGAAPAGTTPPAHSTPPAANRGDARR